MAPKYVQAGEYERVLQELVETRRMLAAVVRRKGRPIRLDPRELAAAGLRTSTDGDGGIWLTTYVLVADEAALAEVDDG